MNIIFALALVGGVGFFLYRNGTANAAPTFEQTADIKTIAYNAILANDGGGYFDPRTIMALIQTESGFNPNAVGNAGEIGLMQITPAAASDAGYAGANLYDPETNIAAGMAYLFWVRDYLLRATKREPSLLEIFSGYNGGVGNVLKGWRSLTYYAKISANKAFV